MLISPNHIELSAKTDHSISTSRYTVYWRGFVYLDGVRAGAPSIEEFARSLEHGSLESSSKLRGIYFLVVCDRASGECFAFVDNSGLFHAFYSERLVGTSFLALAKMEGLTSEDFDPESLVEFLHTGNVYSGKTLFPNIRKIGPGDIVRIPKTGSLSVQRKPLPDIGVPPQLSFADSMRHFAEAATHEQISVDLTGGIDSRMLAVMLQSLGLRFEVATCGTKEHPDVVIAQEVADALGLELQVTERRMNDVDWAEVFKDCDGLFDVVRACSQVQMRRERLKRGINLVVSGVGGELLKDFWWLQDMPFYARKQANIEKLYAFRLSPEALQHSYLSEPYRAVSLGCRQRTLNELAQYVVPGNTRTYDRIYYSYKMREYAGRSISNNLHEVACYAPYLEREVAAFGYQLPRTQRFFNNFHRRTITSLSPSVARIPTTEGGISVSAERSVISRDLLRYASDKLVRLTNKLGQRIFNRSCVQGNFSASDIGSCVREVTRERRTIERLKDSGILSPALQSSEINTDYLGRMLSLDMLLERLEQIRSTTRSITAVVEAA